MDELNAILTASQRRRLARLIRQAQDIGHGEITIRVVKGVPRFVYVRLEESFDPVDDGEGRAAFHGQPPSTPAITGHISR